MSRRLPRLNGRRGVAMLCAAAFAILQGVAYLPFSDAPTELPGGLGLISAIFTIEVWAVVWIGIGVICAWQAFRADDSLGWGLLVGGMLAWSAAYVLGWGLSWFDPDGPSREWLNARTYGLPALIVALLSARPSAPLSEEQARRD